MGILPWEEPLDEVSRCYKDLRDLALEAVQDTNQVVSPVAVINLACAGWALEMDYDYGAALFMLAAIPGLGSTQGRADWIGLSQQAEQVGRRLQEDDLLIAIKEFLTLLLYDHDQLTQLRQRRALYRQEVGSVITADILRSIMPKLTVAEVANFLEPLNAALVEFDIITPQRWMPFLAECAEESIQLQSMREKPSGFASSKSKYKGRGAMQLTGIGNYRAAGKALGLDLVDHPDVVASDASVGFRAGAWFWKSNGLNERADHVRTVADFDKISNVINRGTPNKKALGTDVREAFYGRAKNAWVEYKNRCQTALIAGKVVQI